MKRTRTTWPALTARRSVPLTAALAGMATIGLTLAACGEAGPTAASAPQPGPDRRTGRRHQLAGQDQPDVDQQ
jgi:hypothetical protein